MKNVYDVIYQIMDETALHRLLDDCEEEMHLEHFELCFLDVYEDKIHIGFTAPSSQYDEIKEYWAKQKEWTLLDVLEGKIEYLPIELISFVTEPLELF